MAAKKRIMASICMGLSLVVTYSFCAADEIIFKDKKGRQTGTVVEETEQGITIFFPKESIKSFTRSKESVRGPSPGRIILEESGEYLTVRIPRQRMMGAVPGTESSPSYTRQEPAQGRELSGNSETQAQMKDKVERLEKRLESIEKAEVPRSGVSPGRAVTHEALMQEEMGSVEGTILWNKKPLSGAPIKIVMEQYTGFSVAALRKVFGSGKEKSSSAATEVVLSTQTDSQGHYSFSQVPPGYYTMFWQPDAETGWVRRIREDPDFEALPGKLVVLNIPEKKKQK